ncbi:hypothetical protein [Methyloversatilis sp.]|uniref:DUF3024 domain-containing protein n=1 Tax=Methyloversatilis sp. TaxID=2569862 RepID=UPI0027347567|nr:hypothetical protein [Methyloversatilis sp.]MDP2870743.1 hypothetical protein [Methyloversatilis sp.]MDP3455564.1 hypothetical protein [Methyloversatilis sp.]MDP3578179.1 hypothetical protein [Methyloversatilis sp.]
MNPRPRPPARQPQHAPHAVVAESELLRRRVLRALERRERYRYVRPEVHASAEGWVVTSPCCSRNVDPDGGVIDIALLQRSAGGWTLSRRDHASASWVRHSKGVRLDTLLDVLCEDPQRVFWP